MKGPGIYDVPAGSSIVIQFCAGTILDVQWNDGIRMGWAQNGDASSRVEFLDSTGMGYLMRPLKVPPQAMGLYLFRPAMAGQTRVAIEVL